ncbi:MAG TPA: cation diffusion facilitator family transporter [Anaerolineales bacterium]|nr:cation diffusion facilitator family transporter [Anaerolineales bacterium]
MGAPAFFHSHPHGSATVDEPAEIGLAFFLNLAFTIVEAAGGLWTNSLAILSDSLHDLGDSLTFGLSWYLARTARRGRDERYSYGYLRLSLLGALTSSLVLLVGSLFILARAIPRLIRPEHSNAQGMIALAMLGLVVNGFAAWRLQRGRSIQFQALRWHLIEDVLGWAAVLLVALTLLVMDIHILDPLLSIFFTGYVLLGVVRTLRRTMSVFLQASPEELDLMALDRNLASIPGVLSTHHTHLWSLDGVHHVLTTHLVVNAGAGKDDVLRIKTEALRVMAPIAPEHTTLEIEYEDEDCRMRV